MPKIRQQSNTVAQTIEIDRPKRLTITAKQDHRTTPEHKELLRRVGFQPGVSGNPGGKPRALAEILEIGHRNAPELMRRLVALAKDTNLDPSIRIAATREVFNRTFGKPNQQVEVIGGLEHRHFVLRAPPVLSSADEWERQYDTGEQVIDITGDALPAQDHTKDEP